MPALRSCWVGKGRSGHCPSGFQGDQRDEEEESQMKKSESEVEEAAAIIAQRPDNPREFFRQQERVASASGGSCDAPSPFNHRPGSPWSPPCPIRTPQTVALNPFGTSSWKRSLSQGLLGEGKTPLPCASTPSSPGGSTPQRGWVGGWGTVKCWALAE